MWVASYVNKGPVEYSETSTAIEAAGLVTVQRGGLPSKDNSKMTPLLAQPRSKAASISEARTLRNPLGYMICRRVTSYVVLKVVSETASLHHFAL
jgi:hypothetical protein